jgi:hypothetical protein
MPLGLLSLPLLVSVREPEDPAARRDEYKPPEPSRVRSGVQQRDGASSRVCQHVDRAELQVDAQNFQIPGQVDGRIPGWVSWRGEAPVPRGSTVIRARSAIEASPPRSSR